ncbi:MAG TPA: hypothetical protein DCM38_08170 [Gammaproteobacteria bacterium]|nr:hypothetical protein [Gammaproteobacteria bacterium]
MKKVASLRYGVIFKKAFCVPEIFTAFVRDFTDVQLEVDHIETEKSFAPIIGKIDSRFDLFVEDKRNRIIVDIQHRRLTDHYDRFLHYHCAAILEQASNAENYRPPLKVLTLVVLTSGDKHKTDISTIDFNPRNLEGKSLRETSHKIMYICPKYVNEKTPEPYREWMLAIEDSLDQEVDESQYRHPAIHQLFQQIENEGISPTERAAMFDEQADQEYVKKKIQNNSITIAVNLLTGGSGLTKEQIAQATGLTLEEVNELALSPIIPEDE